MPGSLDFERVHSSGSRSSLGFTSVQSCAPRGFTLALLKSAGSIGFAYDHSGALGVVGFIRVCVGSFWHALVSSRSFGLARVNLGASRGRRVHAVSRVIIRAPMDHSGSREFTRARLGVVGSIGVRVGSHGHSLAFPLVHSGALSGQIVLSGSRGFTRAHLGSSGSIEIGLVHSGFHSGCRVHSI